MEKSLEEGLIKLLEVEDTIFIDHNKLLDDYRGLRKTIIDLDFLIMDAGNMVFTGKSSRMGELSYLREVKINDLAGCKVVPELLKELANKQLVILENRVKALLHKYNKSEG